MSDRKRQRVDAAARRLQLCADDLRHMSSSLASCQFRQPSAHTSIPLPASRSAPKPRKASIPKPSSPCSLSLYSVVSSATYAAKTSASEHEKTWQMTLHRLGLEILEKTGSREALERGERLTRRFEALSDSVQLCQEKLKRVGDDVALQDRVEKQLAQEEEAWEQQMQVREQRVAEREVELQALKEENAAAAAGTTGGENDTEKEEGDDDDEDGDDGDDGDEVLDEVQDQDEQVKLAELAELREALALRLEEKRDIEAAVSSLQRKKARRSAAVAEHKSKGRGQSIDVEAEVAAAAREQVLRELREEKEMLQREIIAAEEMEERMDENVRDLPALKEELAEVKRKKAEVQTCVDSLRLELARQKRKMRYMVDVQLLTARDTNPPTLREEAVLLHLLYEHEGEMGVNELKQEASKLLEDHGKPNGNGVVIRALYSLVANGLVQIDRSHGNGLVTLLLV
ncbi:unnamed protein product [Hyaloperonospora brassicae]|uniref:GRIP domain-containing protein n=1 Tax=Hyaloperonospora brassicae TaxID=162125 RepID=A0AAV0T4T7_HYABA|nr:unnamed protein product [Hyaloperonospora brassicae]